jgi:NACHT domain
MDPVSAAAGGAGRALAKPTIKIAAKAGSNIFDKLKVALTNCFEGHVEASEARCASVKNILYRNEPANLLDQYVNVHFSKQSETIADASLVESLLDGRPILVSGTAGAGKTMFMKWATLALIRTRPDHQKIPLFLELRYMRDDDPVVDLISYIFEKTSSKAKSVSLNQFELGLKRGDFIIILDAVDEINPTLRDRALSGIRDFIRSYPSCPVLISTRPDDALESLQDLSVVKTTSMTLEQIVTVIEKLEYEKSVKSKLIERLREGLYEAHEEFLSNPLLATIMLLTYDQAADIPTKITSFYRQAFEALYQRHDANKGTYKRGHFAELPMDEFEKVFSALCYASYNASKFEFSDTDLISRVRSGAEVFGITKNPELIVSDILQSVCLMQKEGLGNVFVHRSFQEYFAAVFISNYRGPDIRAVVDASAQAFIRGNVMAMLHEINRDLVEFSWMLPNLDEWLEKVGSLRLNTRTGLQKFLRATYPGFGVAADSGLVRSHDLGGGCASRWMSALGNFYRESRFTNLIFRVRAWPAKQVSAWLTKHKSVLPDKYVSGLTQRLSSMRRDHETDDEILSVVPEDAIWLLETDIVQACEEIRSNAHKTKSNIKERQQHTSALMKNNLGVSTEIDG